MPETRQTRRRAAAAMVLSAVALIAVATLMARKSLIGYAVIFFVCGLIVLGSGMVVWFSSQRLRD
jgi:hypothetical protein